MKFTATIGVFLFIVQASLCSRFQVLKRDDVLSSVIHKLVTVNKLKGFLVFSYIQRSKNPEILAHSNNLMREASSRATVVQVRPGIVKNEQDFTRKLTSSRLSSKSNVLLIHPHV